MKPLLFIALAGCATFDPDAFVEWDPTGDTGTDTDIGTDTAVPQVPTTKHCGEITEDVTWFAEDSPHELTCSVLIEGGSLTIEAGAEILFDLSTSLEVSTGGRQGGLTVEGTASKPVVFKSALGTGKGKYLGLRVGSYAGNVTLKYLTVMDAGEPGIAIEDVQVLMDHVTITGSSGDGLDLIGNALLREGSTALVTTNNGGAGVRANPSAVDSINIANSVFDGNALEGVWISGGLIDSEVTWPKLAVSYVLAGSVVVQGIAPFPAILTVEPGTTFYAEDGVDISLSNNAGAAGLFVQGTVTDPVLFTARNAAHGGMWGGIKAFTFTLNDGLALHHTTLEYGGSNGAGVLAVFGNGVLVDHVTLQHNEGPGFELRGGGWFTLGSNNLVSSDNTWPGVIELPNASTLPSTGDLTGNDYDFIRLATTGTAWGNHVLPKRGVPYWLEGSQIFRTMSSTGAVLTVDPGVDIYMDLDAGFTFARDRKLGEGPTGMRALGTPAQPIRFLPAYAHAPGQWKGFTFEDCLTGMVAVDQVEVAYGGTVDAGVFDFGEFCTSATFANSEIHHSLSWGITGLIPTLDNVSFHDNGRGPWLTPSP